MAALIRNRHEGGGGTARLFAFCALIALLAGALLSLAPARADSHNNQNKLPDNLELVLSLANDTDNIVQAGQSFTVNAALRFTTPRYEETFDLYRRWITPQDSDSQLRIGGALGWESSGRQKLTVAGENLVGFERPLAGWIKALHQRTLITRLSNGNLNIYDAWTKQLAGTITRPAGSHSSFAHATSRVASLQHYSVVTAVWHETDSLAWLFVGAPDETVDSVSQMGRVYVFRLDWSDRSVDATLVKTLRPPLTETQNYWHASASRNQPHYGASLNMSRDGSTLVITAENINTMGAVYVYTRPDGPGQSWGDIRYEDGVKVTATAVPSFGSSAATAPFTPSSTGRTGAATDCDAYCSRAASMFTLSGGSGTVPTELGVRHVAISADGRVVAVGAIAKSWSMETPGGNFGRSGAHYKQWKGESYVFVAPEGGWNAAPRADMDADGNAKTLIAAQANATGFDPDRHYSPGPLRRITEPDAVLVERLWTDMHPPDSNPNNSRPSWVGEGIALSPDGATFIATGNLPGNVDWHSGRAYIFQQSSPAGWQTLGERALNDRYMTPTATVNDIGYIPGYGTMTFSADSDVLIIATRHRSWGTGRLHVIERPADGTWVTLSANTSPDVLRRGGISQAMVDGPRLLMAQDATSYLSDGGCTVEVADGQETATCPIPMNGTVVVPEGAADGTFTISAQLTVQLEGVTDSAVRLSGELEARIGAAPKLAEARLELANDWRGTTSTADDRPFPSLIERGGKTRLQLQILDEAGLPASTGSVASLVVSTTLGGLTSLVYDGACAGASGQTSCTIPTSALTGENSDELLFELAHKGMAGAATVWATLVSAEGEALTTEQLTIDLAGAPTALAIAAPPAALLGYAPADDTDPRNKTTLAVSASDKGGNRASVPDTVYSAKLTDPDGKTITLTGANRKAELAWPLREADADTGALLLRDGNPQARVTILAAKTAPLTLGEYTLELSAGAGANKLTATQKFNVSGGAAAVALSADPTGQVSEGETVTFTAMVRDASGAPVPDGTPVSFSEQSAGSNVALVLLSGSSQLTSGGRASVTLRAVGRGRAYVTATSDDVSDIELVTVVEPPPPPLEQSITDLAIGGFTIWTSPRPTSAAALFAALEGVTRISIWDGIEWISYGVRNGLLLPGSIDFEITRGRALWLAGG